MILQMMTLKILKEGRHLPAEKQGEITTDPRKFFDNGIAGEAGILRLRKGACRKVAAFAFGGQPESEDVKRFLANLAKEIAAAQTSQMDVVKKLTAANSRKNSLCLGSTWTFVCPFGTSIQIQYIS